MNATRSSRAGKGANGKGACTNGLCTGLHTAAVAALGVQTQDFFKPRGAAATSPKVRAAGVEHEAASGSQREQQVQHGQHVQQAAIKEEPEVKTETAGAGLRDQQAAAAVNADEPPADRQQAAAAAAAGRHAAGEREAAAKSESTQRLQRGQLEATAGASPASGQKRKQEAAPGSGKAGGGNSGKSGAGPGLGSKKARPAGQRPISQFFAKG